MENNIKTADDIVLSVRGLKTFFKLREGTLKAVNEMSFDVRRGKVIGIVGESGCGKSITSKSILRIVKKPGYSEGEILFKKKDGSIVNLVDLKPNSSEMREIRGDQISMIFQEPMNALSPVHSIGNQLTEAMMLHDSGLTKDEAFKRGVTLLEKVGISNPETRMHEYSFQLSGGMRQRVMIAMAISCNPSILIADEPTTALDVSVQAQILKLLRDLQTENDMAMIFITHDLSVVAQMADTVAVMYLGLTVETGPTETIFENPSHPYTQKLLASIMDPRINYNREKLETIKGNVPEPIGLPDRCPFYNRCEKKIDGVCEGPMPKFKNIGEDHFTACYHVEALQEGAKDV